MLSNWVLGSRKKKGRGQLNSGGASHRRRARGWGKERGGHGGPSGCLGEEKRGSEREARRRSGAAASELVGAGVLVGARHEG